jgi:hypothetical protein
MLVSDIASQLNDGLHTLDFSFNLLVKVILIDLWESKEVDRSCVLIGLRRYRNEWTETLVKTLCQKWCIGRLIMGLV